MIDASFDEIHHVRDHIADIELEKQALKDKI
jgi:hypothetical protein